MKSVVSLNVFNGRPLFLVAEQETSVSDVSLEQ